MANWEPASTTPIESTWEPVSTEPVVEQSIRPPQNIQSANQVPIPGVPVQEPQQQSHLSKVFEPFTSAQQGLRQDWAGAGPRAEASIQRSPGIVNIGLARGAQLASYPASLVNRSVQAMTGAAYNSTLSPFMSAVHSLLNEIPGYQKNIEQPRDEAISNTLGSLGKTWNKAPEEIKNVASLGGSALSLLPTAGKPAGILTESLGKQTTKLGVNTMEKALAIPNKIVESAKIGPRDTPKAIKDRIVKTMTDHKLESVTGDFNKTAQKTVDLIDNNQIKVDKLVDDFTIANPNKKIVKVPDLLEELKSDVYDVKSTIPPGKEDVAIRIIKGLEKSAEERGFVGTSGNIELDNLVAWKKSLNSDGKLFTHGLDIGEDAVDRQIRAALYLKITDKIGEIVKEVQTLNRDTRDLLLLKEAAEVAGGRTSTPLQSQLFNQAALAVGGGGVLLSNSPVSRAGIIAGTAALIALNKAKAGGRGPAVALKLGKKLTQTGQAIKGAAKISPVSPTNYINPSKEEE